MSESIRQLETSDRVSIAEASRRWGVSRRTIERWIRDGLLSALHSEGDRRQRLVDPADVETLSRESRRRRRPQHGQTGKNAAETDVGADRRDRVDEMPRDFQDVIDQALQLAYSSIHRTISQVYPPMFSPLSLEQLRQGPLGQDLARLAAIAEGKIREPRERVLSTIESIVQLLFWPMAADDYMVPRTFWDTEVGRMMALAKYRAYDSSELVSIGNAAKQLGVSRPTIYLWMDDRTLDYVRDDMSGRTFVNQRDVADLKRKAMEMSRVGQEVE